MIVACLIVVFNYTPDHRFAEEDHRNWDRYIPEFSMALSSSVQESAGFSTTFLDFGRELVLPSSDDQEDQTEGIAKHRDRLGQLSEVFSLIRKNIAKAFTKQAHHYDLRHREWRPHVGDLVLRKDHPLSKADLGYAAKLAPTYSGPYLIHTVESLVVFTLKHPVERKKIPRVKYLKLYQN
ncbi:hypothetical protein RI129_006450 [Pyrocoelia pectoralis]|uniref:Uncharacterized protein n=1 Tax=Pyrocoelia pectoralis TaxID=417401 RepID=A0AAN7VBA0_9COLE